MTSLFSSFRECGTELGYMDHGDTCPDCAKKEFIEKEFNVLVADPPWLFGDKLPGKKRGASKNYKCLTLPEIIEFKLPKLSDDCWLFLWRVGAMQQEALTVAKAWGFRVDSDIPWVKVPRIKTAAQFARHAIRFVEQVAECDIFTCSDPKMAKANAHLIAETAARFALVEARRVRIGMGRSVRNAHESCLVCKRGKPYRDNKGVPSVIFGERDKHSKKPNEFYHTVDELVGPNANVVELFARRQWPGWTCLGDQMATN